jgi:hypothetical protein
MLIDPLDAVKIIASLYFRFLLRFTFLKINEVVMTSPESWLRNSAELVQQFVKITGGPHKPNLFTKNFIFFVTYEWVQ